MNNNIYTQFPDNVTTVVSNILNKSDWQNYIVIYIIVGIVIGIIVIGICSICSKSIKCLHNIKSIRRKTISFSIKNISAALAKTCRFGYILVRFGTDEFLKDSATDAEKNITFLQNEEVYVKSKYDKINDEIKVIIPLKIHKTLGTQFKIFVDIMDDLNKLDDVKSLLQEDGQFDDVKVSDSLNKNRIYFLHKGLPETKTPEGFRNNFICPK